jgi:cytochrome c-type biogenesis protein CcmH
MWILFALMTALAVFAVLWPLSRRPATDAETRQDMAVYRDQLAEIETDRERGLIGAQEAEAARLEVSRRLLQAASSAPSAPSSARDGLWRRRAAAVIALIIMPVAAMAAYVSIGQPGMPDQPLVARLNVPPGESPVDQMVAQVERHLATNPQDGRGWEVLAPYYMAAGRTADAVKARGNALRLLGATSDREADLGEALVAEAQGVVTADAKSAFQRAIALQADHVKARFFVGLAAEQDGNAARAASVWREMLVTGPADAPWRPVVERALARVAPGEKPPVVGAPSPAAPGPSAADVANAQQMAPADQQAMVRGMVDRLAQRLKTETGDLDGWVRLVRAYMVLGETEKVKSTLVEARRALAGDPDKLQSLEAQIRGLGLEG